MQKHDAAASCCSAHLRLFVFVAGLPGRAISVIPFVKLNGMSSATLPPFPDRARCASFPASDLSKFLTSVHTDPISPQMRGERFDINLAVDAFLHNQPLLLATTFETAGATLQAVPRQLKTRNTAGRWTPGTAAW